MANKETGEKQNVITVSAPPVGHDEEKVTVRLFRDNGQYKDDVYVAVNGQRVRIKRGVDVQIPRKFARVLEQSEEQDARTADLIGGLEADRINQGREFGL